MRAASVRSIASATLGSLSSTFWNAVRPRRIVSTSDSASTVAVRGAASSSASSPKKSPRRSFTERLPGLRTAADPSRIT